VPEATVNRVIGDLASTKAGSALRASSILCLPMGSTEQHGPHLPFDTDTVLAEAFTRRIVGRWGDDYDLWQLPSIPIGLSREHDWAPGTQSHSVAGMAAHLRGLARDVVRALPARNLLIVNGHGGNRGILEAIGRELRGDFGLNLCAMHLGAMISPVTDVAIPEIHAGKDETSVMLAVAPDRIDRDKMRGLKASPGGGAVHTLILDPATSWPWSSDDKRLGNQGVIGDAATASAEHGQAIVARVVEASGAVLKQLVENAKVSAQR
jgi:creatinine amidohydrolase